MSWARHRVIEQKPDESFEGRWGNLFWVKLQDFYSGHTFVDSLRPWSQAEIDLNNLIIDLLTAGKIDYKEACHLEDMAYGIGTSRQYVDYWRTKNYEMGKVHQTPFDKEG